LLGRDSAEAITRGRAKCSPQSHSMLPLIRCHW